MERRDEYRRKAAAAQREADRTREPSLKRSLQKLADGWSLLADQIETQIALAAQIREMRERRASKPR